MFADFLVFSSFMPDRILLTFCSCLSNYFLDQSQFEGNEHILAKVTRNIFVSES